MNQHKNFVIIAFLGAILSLAVSATASVPNNGKLIRPAEPAEHSVVVRDRDLLLLPGQADLEARLCTARRQGDVEGARKLMAELGELCGRPTGSIVAGARNSDVTVEAYRAGNSGHEKWQGNDVLIAGTSLDEYAPDIVGDSAGYLYAGFEIFGSGSPVENSAYLYRSIDGGESWTEWFWIHTTSDIGQVSLTVGEGSANYLYMAYTLGGTDIVVFRVNLDDINDYSTTTIETDAAGMANPRVATDSDEFSSGWYAYLVYNANGVDNWVLRFSCSTDYGNNWQAPTTVHSYCGYPDQHYDGSRGKPDLDFGNNKLHLAFDDNATCVSTDRDVFVSVSDNFGNSWATPLSVTGTEDDEYDPAIAAARLSDPGTVVAAYTVESASEFTEDVNYSYSFDWGGTWVKNLFLSAYSNVDEFSVDVAASKESGLIHFCFIMNYYTVYYGSAPFDHPEALAWSGGPIGYIGHDLMNRPLEPAIAVDPAQALAEEAAIVWCEDRPPSETGYDIYFDGASTVGLGTISIQAEPDTANAAWHLQYFPSGFDLYGNGDLVLTDMEEGDYTLTWLDTGEWTPTCTTPQTLNLAEGKVLVFACDYRLVRPLLTAVQDVDNDQGRQLRLIWQRSAYDAPGLGDDITGYEVMRRQDADKLAGWDWLDWVPAHGDDEYQYVATSLCDSTAEGGVCWTAYLIRAATADPFVYFDSPPDSGYSVDNLAPGIPVGLAAAYQQGGVALDWVDAPEPDFRYYRIYRSTAPGFVTAQDNLAHETVASDWTDSTTDPWGFYYLVTVVDQSGNESEAAAPDHVSGLPSVGLSGRTALLDAVPNPFNPRTTLAFELASAGPVRLLIYDAAGRRVATLVDGYREAGRHAEVWDGRDSEGRMSAAGVYLCRLEAGPYRETRRLVLVK